MSETSDDLKELLLKTVPDRVSFENGFYKVMVGPNLYFFIKTADKANEYEMMVGAADGKKWLYKGFETEERREIYKVVSFAHNRAAENHIDRNLPHQHHTGSFYEP